MFVFLLDDTVRVEVYCDEMDREYEDNICVSFVEKQGLNLLWKYSPKRGQKLNTLKMPFASKGDSGY